MIITIIGSVVGLGITCYGVVGMVECAIKLLQ